MNYGYPSFHVRKQKRNFSCDRHSGYVQDALRGTFDASPKPKPEERPHGPRRHTQAGCLPPAAADTQQLATASADTVMGRRTRLMDPLEQEGSSP